MKEMECVIRESLFLNNDLDVVKLAAKRSRIAVPEVIFSEGQSYSEEYPQDKVPPRASFVRISASHESHARFWGKYEKLAEKKAKAALANRVPKPPKLISGPHGFLTDIH